MTTVPEWRSGDQFASTQPGASKLGGVFSVGFMQWALAALLVGAGAVHFAMVPSHFDESVAEGIGFLVAAWLQVALAVVVVLRPSRSSMIAVVVVSAACLVAWGVSRIVGLPFGAHSGHAESVTIVDGLTVAMEALAVVVAGALIWRPALSVRSRLVGFAAVAVVLLVTSVALTAPEASDHATAAHGDEAAGASADHSHAEPAPGVQAAEPIVSDSNSAVGALSVDGHDHGASESSASSGEVTDLNGHVVTGVKAEDIAHEHQPDVPLDAATRALLSEELVVARATAMKYPTVADAEAAGYHLVAGFGPGSGAHYIGGPMTGPGKFDATKAQSLIYSGTNPTSEMVGLMYFGMGETAPEGFAGPNDHWHRHSSVCVTYGPNGMDVPFPPDADVTKEQCSSVKGMYMEITGWMVHAWVVPSWESPDGVFSHENPNLRCADGTYDTDSVGKCEGI